MAKEEDILLEEEQLKKWDDGICPDEQKAISLRELQNRLYWEQALNVVNSWSAYNGKKKLYINATHSETENKVRHVLNKSFAGNPSKVADRRDQLKLILAKDLATFTDICQDFKMPVITENWCFNNIPNGKVAASLRGKINRLIAKNEPMRSLETLL